MRSRILFAILAPVLGCTEPDGIAGTYDGISVEGLPYPAFVGGAWACSAELRLLRDGTFALNRVKGTDTSSPTHCTPEQGLSQLGSWSSSGNTITLMAGSPANVGTVTNGVVTLDESGQLKRRWVFERRR